MRTTAALLALCALILTGCGTAGTQVSSPAPITAVTSSSESSSVAEATSPVVESSPTASVTPTVSVTYECSRDDGSGSEDAYQSFTFNSLDEVWAAQYPYEYCEVTRNDVPLTATETAALTKAYGAGTDAEVTTLYGICARQIGIPIDKVVSEVQGQEATGAILLCPNHPKIASIRAQIAAATAIGAEDRRIQAAEKEKKVARSGTYLIGKDLVPGTYESMGEKVTQCYWEVSDAQGNIIANNFISVAPKFRITIPATASGFTARNCSFIWVGS